MEITKESIEGYIKEYGAVEAFKGFAELVDKRAYFTVRDFEVKRKPLNIVIPAFAFFQNNESILTEAFMESIDARERFVMPKIDRVSNMNIEKVKENFEKLLVKNSFEHALKYGKELLLREEKSFWEITTKVALMDRVDLLKPLLVLSFKKIARKEDEFLYLFLSYMCKAKSEFTDFERAKNENTVSKNDVLRKIEGRKPSREVLGAISYLLLLQQSGIENPKCLEMLNNYVLDIDGNGSKLSSVEKLLLDELNNQLTK